MTILGPKLVSSETREGFLGSTIDSIFWQVWRTFIYFIYLLFFIVWERICILSMRVRLRVTRCPLHLLPQYSCSIWFFPHHRLQSEQTHLPISKSTFLLIERKLQFQFQEISVRVRQGILIERFATWKGKYRSEFVIRGIWAVVSLSCF